jgi:adenine-specific DNA-methyltransferase
MKLKHAILETMSRDTLKQICGDIEIVDVDLRSVETMTAKLSRARRATAELLIEYLSEDQVKSVAERVGSSSSGRRAALIKTLLAADGSGNDSEGLELTALAPNGGSAGVAGARSPKKVVGTTGDQTDQYRHSQQAVQRPDVGVQEQFTKRKPPKTYRYDSSLDPALSWDENRDRELAEWLLGLIEQAAENGEKVIFETAQDWKGGGVRVDSTRAAVGLLKRLTKPFLNWAGKAERHQISVPTVPLFVHERHSTKAILDGIRHRKAKGTTLDLFGDAQMDIGERLDAYEHQGPWQNRMILGDSLQIMNSMLEFEGLGGQVQMIYIDPPYGVKFGSNFQPFVRKRDVKDGADSDLTREPEMVKAYRDTWKLGLHSYLTYFRDRLLLSHELLNESGSAFVQISDDNLHHVRALMDEIFGADHCVAVIPFKKTSGAGSPSEGTKAIAAVNDYILWYGKNSAALKYNPLYTSKRLWAGDLGAYTLVELRDGTRRPMNTEERQDLSKLPDGARVFRADNLTGQSGVDTTRYPVEFAGKVFKPLKGVWKTSKGGMEKLRQRNRLILTGETLKYVRFHDDFAVQVINGFWEDTVIAGFGEEKLYVVQTSAKVVQRCILMATDPGDLIFDPTCGSGTTAYVAEQWGRRWITCDSSRVPLALARQRLLTATFPYYDLKEPKLGPSGGFVYKRKQNKKGEEIGGLVPHVTLKSIANDEPPAMEVLVDRPEESCNVTRVSGPFVVEATIAPAQSLDYPTGDAGISLAGSADPSTHIERMTQLLRQSKTLRLPENQSIELEGIRRMSEVEYLHAEAVQADEKQRIAIVFGPEDGAISSDLVYNAASEAFFLKYVKLYFFGFAIQAKARELLEDRKKLRIPCFYIAVTPDVAMADLLKTSRSSEIFSVTGLPDFEVKVTGKKSDSGEPLYQATLAGLDIFDPSTLKQDSIDGASVPAWMLDCDYDGLSFHATQVFFPKTSAWDNLQRSLKATFDDSVWAHLAGTTSEPFVLGEKKRVAVKVIDERGNELMRVLDVK